MKLSREQVLHIAELAKLGINEQETEMFAEQLSDILEYAERLNKLDTSAIARTAQVIKVSNVTRSDTVTESLSVDQALANAPDRSGDYVRVKAIFDNQDD